MMQLVYCKCGESMIQDGRCSGCKAVRPSSKEVQEEIDKYKETLKRLEEELKKAERLEKEDKEGNEDDK